MFLLFSIWICLSLQRTARLGQVNVGTLRITVWGSAVCAVFAMFEGCGAVRFRALQRHALYIDVCSADAL